MKTIKDNENSRILIRKIVDTGIDMNGNRFVKVNWFKLEQPLNLGSLAKPQNTDVDQIKIEIPEDPPKNVGDLFGGLFKK